MRAWRGSGLRTLATTTCLALGGVTLAPTVRADDRTEALAILTALEHQPEGATLAKQPGSATPLPETDNAVTRAKEALERALRMRNAGDTPHATLAEGLGLEWAETARDRARTRAVEAKAREAETATIEATAHGERERALLEEAIARSGRLKAEVALATKKGGGAKAREHTSMAATTDVVTKPKAGKPGRKDAPGAAGMTPAKEDADAPAPPGDAPAQGVR